MNTGYAAFLFAFFVANTCQATEAITYEGAIAKLPIVVELTEPDAKGNLVGRYAYKAKGLDIPLHGKKLKNRQYQLREEEPCTDKNCRDAAGDLLEIAPLSFRWTLSGGDKNLTGTWSDPKTGKSLPIVLQRVGSRTLPDDDISDISVLDPMMVHFSTSPPTKDTMPYDVLKLEHPLKQGDVQEFSGVKYRMDTDPRIDLTYPTIVDYGKTDPKPVNDYFQQQRLEASILIFSCLSNTYLGFGWSGQENQGGIEFVFEYASKTLLGFVENTGLECGGPHPSYSTEHKLVDVRTGEPVVAEKLLRGWVAKDGDGNVVDASKAEDPSSLTYGPDADLAKFIVDHLDPAIDSGKVAECWYPKLINTNLGVYVSNDNLVFTLKDLPNVSFACTVDLAKVPLKQAESLFTDEGKAYFAEMGK